ncbi:MAG: carboxypeptidase regulatory-like domain-containing protein [Holophagales bacterium]|nr:carboxypeptidase regulatory-like domain-containing protein [Holophagales bacterium]MYG31393.1 carboxypeptidase regulatory-like domain-containing protein [Holophagales bacterium]MYI78987.1 carboxypeptidase regulatory-like domain-containing protein [Holophagales bacterium]
MIVLGASGEPAAEATVTVLRSPTEHMVASGAVPTWEESPERRTAAILLRTTTTAEGVVRDALPQLRGLAVVVDHPMHLPFSGWYPNEALPDVIRLQAGRVATGVVQESGSGEPVAGAEVCAFWRGPDLLGSFAPEWRCVESGEGGRFKLAGLPAAALDATAEAFGFETDARTIAEGRGATRVLFELVAKNQAVGEVEASPASAGLVRVQLVGPGGEAIRNFTMRVHAVGRIGSASHEIEDAEGRVSVPISAAYANERAVDVSFQAADYLQSPLIRVVPAPGAEVDLGVIALDRGTVVQGRLFDAAGAEPAVGCLVELLPAGSGAIGAILRPERNVAVSDSEGRYLLGGLEAGRYHLRVQCPGVPVADRFLALGTNETADQGESWLHPGRRVAVRVNGLGGGTVRLLDRFREIAAPVVEAVLGSSTRTGASHRREEHATMRADFAAAPGVYRLEVVDGSGRLRVSQEIRIAEGPAEVQVVDLMLQTRAIRSVLFMGGRPVAGGRVSFGSVFDASRSSMKLVISTLTDRGESRRLLGVGGSVSHRVSASVELDGLFMVENAPVDLLWMTWAADDGSRIGRLWPADPLPLMDLSGVRVTGELRGADGAPVGGQVAVITDIGRAVAYAEVGDDGRFLLPPAPPGSYRIRADAGVSPTLIRQGRSRPRGSVSKDITLSTGGAPHQMLIVDNDGRGTAEVDLRRADGSPAAGAWLHFVSAAGDAVGGGLASAAGQMTRTVPAGEVTIVWNDAVACVGGVGLSAEAGRTAALRQSLPMGRLVELRCRAYDCAGEPLSFLSVTTKSGAEIASHLSGAGEGVRFSEFGRLGLGCVTPGTYAVSFWAAGRRWGTEVNVSSKGPAGEPVIVNGREAGL